MNAESKPDGSGGDLQPDQLPETFSQFVARVLSQLSLVAWLPSGALVLALTFIVQIASKLGADARPQTVGAVIGGAFDGMTRIGFSGALLLFAAVVVLTILTQVFAFDAILTLGGHWGTTRLAEWIAKYRCEHYRRQLIKFQERKIALIEKAWCAARTEIEARQALAIDSHDESAIVRQWTPDELSIWGAMLTGTTLTVEAASGESRPAVKIPWEGYAPPDLLRRQANIGERINDFPAPVRIMPTRLGNIIRAYGDKVGRQSGPVQTFALEVYGRLPAHLQSQHHEWRNRLDLYCSMVFVIALVTCISAVLLGAQNWRYALSVLAAGIILMWLAYRAAIATARIYGHLMLVMKRVT